MEKYSLYKNKKSLPRRKFTEEEDRKLSMLVSQLGLNKWNIISGQMEGRTGRQCRDRYRNYLQPGFFNGQWTQGEDELLYKKYQELGPQWSLLSHMLVGRSANSIKNRWNYFVSRLDMSQIKENQANKDETKNISDIQQFIPIIGNEIDKIPINDVTINPIDFDFSDDNDIFGFYTQEFDFSSLHGI